MLLRSQQRRIAEWTAAMARVRAAYVTAHGRQPRMIRPRRFSEKIQWRKLFDFDPRYTVLCDKLAVREFITARVGDAHLVPLLWSGGPAGIPFDRLSPPYVLKSTHASGQVAMVLAPPVDAAGLRGRAAEWVALTYGLRYDEPGYSRVPAQLIVEPLITADDGSAPEEVRMFVFDGRVAVANTILNEDGRLRNGAFHTRDWTRLDWHLSRRVDRDFPPPQRLADMIRIAECLGSGLDHVRVDFYDCGPRLYVGEMTLYSWSGHAAFQPDEADFVLGARWRLRLPLLRAAAAMLLRRRAMPKR